MRNISKAVFLALILALTLPLAAAVARGGQPPIPQPPVSGDYVLDTLNWLSDSQEAAINTSVAALDNAGLAEIAVVTLDDCGQDKQMFRNDLFRSWGIGHVDDNDGLLILVCWYGGDKSRRSLEQEVGYGMEGTIPDLLTSRAAKQIFVPAFQGTDPIGSGKAGEALVAMVKAYDDIIRGGTPTELQESAGGISPVVIIVVVLLLVLLFVAWAVVGGSGGSSSGTWIGGSTYTDSSDTGSSFGGGSAGGGGSSTGF